MIFTIPEIRNFLSNQKSIELALKNLSEESILECNKYDPTHLNYERNDENLKKYEAQIGIAAIKEKNLELRRRTNGNQGKYWMALSPKWINDIDFKTRLATDFEIAYWVNYGDDETYGWFSVEQIKEWLTSDKKLKDVKITSKALPNKPDSLTS